MSELPDPVLEWLYTKWRERLNPSASAQDLKLRDAVEAEYKRRKTARVEPQGASEPPQQGQDTTPSRETMLDELYDKIEDLVMTRQQFMGYLQLAGFNTQAKEAIELTDYQLQWLLKNWETTKASIEAVVKPPPPEPKPKRKRTRK